MKRTLDQQETASKRTRIAPVALPRIEDLLSNLEKDQLIAILTSLATNTDTHSQIVGLMPRPTLEHITQILLRLEKKVADSFPYSKFGPDRSDYSYNRVKSSLEDLKLEISQYLDFFVLSSSYPLSLEHEYPVQAYQYLHFVTSLVHRFPIWENQSNNLLTKSFMYDKLAMYWKMLVSETCKSVNNGKVYGSAVVGEWAHNLMLHTTEVRGQYGFEDVWTEFKKNLGWILGWDSGPFTMVAGRSTYDFEKSLAF
jgi:hypothetical protein